AVTAFSGVRWSNSSLLRALAELKPQTLRYPGGTVANYWDWRQGWFVRGAQVPPNWYNLPPAPAPLEDFKQAIKASGATPVFVLNMLTSTLDAQLAMLRHARWLGLPVALVELGNEFYLNAPDYAAAFPTGQDYG